MTSQPTTRRRLAATAIVGVAFIYVVAEKLLRNDGQSLLAPPWLAGVLPNLAAAAFVPLLLLGSPRVVTGRDYLGMIAAINLGLLGYEIAQLAMPRRTFDWSDIAATLAGAPVALLLGLPFLRRR